MSWVEELRSRIAKKWPVGSTFRLVEVYEFLPELRRLYPHNATIESTVRRVLQELRDSEELRFVDNSGTYRRVR